MHLVFVLGVYDKLRTRYVQMSVRVHLVFVLGVYDKLRTRYVQNVGVSAPPGFGRDTRYRKVRLQRITRIRLRYIYRVIDAREIE